MHILCTLLGAGVCMAVNKRPAIQGAMTRVYESGTQRHVGIFCAVLLLVGFQETVLFEDLRSIARTAIDVVRIMSG